MGRLTLNILLSFAQFEREIIGERIRDKIAAQRKRGQWTGGFPVLGYDVDRSGPSPKLVVNGEEAARVRAIFALYLELSGLLPVVAELAKRGWLNKAWTTKKGNPKGGGSFDKGSLHALLTNPLYAGQITLHGERYAGQHEAIVPAETFEAVQRRLADNRRYAAKERNKHAALLQGIQICRACGRAMVHTAADSKSGTHRYRYYRCSRQINSGAEACPMPNLPAADIERAVLDEVRAISQDETLRRDVLAQARKLVDEERTALAAERTDLQRELGRHHAELGQLAANGAEGGTAARIAELHERIARAEARLDEIRVRCDALERPIASRAGAALRDFDATWARLEPWEQVQLVSLLVAKVELDADDGTIAVSFHPAAIRTLDAEDAA